MRGAVRPGGRNTAPSKLPVEANKMLFQTQSPAILAPRQSYGPLDILFGYLTPPFSPPIAEAGGRGQGTRTYPYISLSLCTQARQPLRISRHYYTFYLKSRRCRHIEVNLKLEAGVSESSPPSQPESPAQALPDS